MSIHSVLNYGRFPCARAPACASDCLAEMLDGLRPGPPGIWGEYLLWQKQLRHVMSDQAANGLGVGQVGRGQVRASRESVGNRCKGLCQEQLPAPEDIGAVFRLRNQWCGSQVGKHGSMGACPRAHKLLPACMHSPPLPRF